MDLIQNIEINSIEKAENILKEADTDLLFKAGQYHFKYIAKVLKNGHVQYKYATPKTVRKIKGKYVPTMHNPNRMITKDVKRKKFMLYYTDEMKTDLQNKISELNGVTDVRWRDANTTNSSYFKFKRNGENYEVRFADHTASSKKDEPNEVLPHIKCIDGDWEIDAGLGKFKPNDIVKITNGIDKATKKYNNYDFQDKLEDFAIENSSSFLADHEDTAHLLTEKYINKNHLKDDKYGTTFKVIMRVMKRAVRRVE